MTATVDDELREFDALRSRDDVPGAVHKTVLKKIAATGGNVPHDLMA